MQRNRLALCFEPKVSAKKRQTQNNKEPNQVEIPRDRMGNIDLMTKDKQALKSEVEAYENKYQIPCLQQSRPNSKHWWENSKELACFERFGFKSF